MIRLSRLLLFSLILSLVFASYPAPAAQAGGPTFTVTVKSAFLRSAPDLSAERVYSVFRNQAYPITGRVADNSWVQLNNLGWITVGLGQMSGDVNSVPVLTAVAATPDPSASATPIVVLDVPATTSLDFTITLKSAFVRKGPSRSAERIGSAFKGQVYRAVSRSLDSQWIQVQFGSQLGWFSAGAGKLSGALTLLSTADYIALEAAGGATPWVPVISSAMRDVYDSAPTSGRNQAVFTAVGDCNSESPVLLKRLREGRYNLTGYEHLRAVRDYFAPSYGRDSLATYGGFNTAAILDPKWGNPKYCLPTEGPLECELRVSGASIAFIGLGTGDQYIWRDSESNFRRIIEYALTQRVIPVLVTKADTLENLQGGAEPEYLNNLMRRLGQEYQIPVLDFWLTSRYLSTSGLQADGFHLNTEGINVRLLTVLQTLDAIWRK